jgi:hypothetical protein
VAESRTFQDPLALRLDSLARRGNALIAEGLPYPVDQLQTLVEHLRDTGETTRAEQALARAERLLERAETDWRLLRELTRRGDELAEIARKAGLDIADVDTKIGDPQAILHDGRLSEGLLERASAVASKRVTVLHDVLPRYFVEQAKPLGHRIRGARTRGQDVEEATDAFNKFLKALDTGHLRSAGAAFLELRRLVADIPDAPAFPVFPRDEQEEILREARQLGRRLDRLKHRARDASGAARFVSQVRAAIAEERRVTTPEEEIEALWNEVDQLSRERGPPRERAAVAESGATSSGPYDPPESQLPPSSGPAGWAPLQEEDELEEESDDEEDAEQGRSPDTGTPVDPAPLTDDHSGEGTHDMDPEISDLPPEILKAATDPLEENSRRGAARRARRSKP